MIEQWVIDRWHHGQERYRGQIIGNEIEIIDNHFPASLIRRSIWDFIFNKKWGLALAFGKWLYDNKKTYLINGHSLEKEHTYRAIAKDLEIDIMYEMILADDPVKALKGLK